MNRLVFSFGVNGTSLGAPANNGEPNELNHLTRSRR